MDANAIFAIIGGTVLAFAVRFFNLLLQWLSRVLGVAPADPIPTAHEVIDRSGPTALPSEPETHPTQDDVTPPGS